MITHNQQHSIKMYLLHSLLLCFVTIISCESDEVLLKFKKDVDKVGEGFENLIFDMVKKIVDDVGVYQDYYVSDEVTTQHSVTKKVLGGVENTTEEYGTEKTTLLKNSTQYDVTQHNRLKRFVEENSSIALNQSRESKSTSESPVTNDTSCTNPKSAETLTVDQINDLKEEIKKLHDLVMLLKDQQRIISFLDNNTKNFDSDISSRFGVGDILKILDYVNTKDIQDQRNKYSTTKTDNDNNELSNIRNDLKEAISTLNKTKHVLTMERKKELLLEKELTDQKLDISFLKMMVEKLFKNSVGNTGNEILGTTQHLPKKLPVHRLVKATVEPTNLRRTFENEESKPGVGNSDSDLDELERLIRKFNQPKKTDIESKIFELQRELNKKKQEDSTLKQLKSLEKYLELRKKQQNFDNESEMAKIFQLPTKTTEDGKGRALDDEIEVELQKLQEAIDSLKTNDEEFATNEATPTDDEKKQFQIMLKKMFGNQNRKNEYETKRFQTLDKMSNEESRRGIMDGMVNQDGKNNVNNPIYREQSLLLREIMELRKQLANSEKSQFGGGYNYGYSDIYGQNPHQMNFPADRYKNNRPNYPQYTDPIYQNSRSHYFNFGAGPNQQYTNLDPTSSYPKLTNPNFLPTYFNPASQEFKKTLDGTQNLNNQYNFDQNRYQSHLGPNNFNQEYQNLPQSKDFDAPVPPYRYSPETNAEFQPLTELHEIPFTISVLPSHKAFNLEANTAEEAYKEGKHPFQQDRNQFFPTTRAKSTSEFFRPPEAPPGSSTGQSGAYTSKTAANVGHAYQTVEDLKAQIYNLQSIIDGLNKPNYTQTLQDKETIAGLEKQISELKGVVNSINSDPSSKYAPLPPKLDQNHIISKLPGKVRRKKSIENNELNEDSQLYDQVVSGLKTLIFKKENEIPNRSSYDEIQSKINDLKYQLESRTHSKNSGYSPTLSLNNYQPPYYQHNHFVRAPPPTHHFQVTTAKENDVFTALVIKIVDKLIASAPAILERLFGHGITELSNFEGYDVQNLFKSLGFFGYGPLIFLRLIDGFTTFVKILRRNSFFKNFLTPASIVLLVAGAVIFLVWWLQPNEDVKSQPSSYYDKYNEQYSNYNYRSRGYGSR